MSVLRSPFFGTENQNLVTQNVDGIEYVVGVELNGVPVDPTNSLWNTIASSDEAVAPFNIITGQSGKNPIDYIAPVELQFKYFDDQVAKNNNGESSQKEIGSSDSSFYGSGVVGGPRQFQQPGDNGGYGPKNRYIDDEPLAMAYPMDISTKQDHLMIKKYKYTRGEGLKLDVNRSRPGTDTRGKKYDGFAILPMPKVSDSNGAEWGESDLNVFGIGAVSTLATPARLGGIMGKVGEAFEGFQGGFDINKLPDFDFLMCQKR